MHQTMLSERWKSRSASLRLNGRRSDQGEINPQKGDSLMATKKKPSERKYGAAAGKQVETEMHEFKQGKLKSGRSGKKVTNPKQAIAIGLSEARKKGAKVPPQKS